MTFKGMLKILVNDYKKQYDQKMFTIADELMKTRREVIDLKEKLRTIQVDSESPASSLSLSSTSDVDANDTSTISLFIQYSGFFKEQCDIRRTMPIKELLTKLRQVTGVPKDYPIRLRVLSEDGLTTLFFLDEELDRTLDSYGTDLKPQMILSIEDYNEGVNSKLNCLLSSRRRVNSERTSSLESDV